MRNPGVFIGGEWLDSPNSIENINPSDTQDIVGTFQLATEQQMRDAVGSARAAAAGWASTTTQARSDILSRAAQEMLARKDSLAELVCREAGKTRAEGVGEVVRAAQVLNFFAGEAVRYGGENIPSVRPNISVQVSREALGVVTVITPWNFPIAIAAWKIGPALAFGNTVVFKPSEYTPAIACELANIFSRSGLPAGVLNVVVGDGVTAGETLLENVDAVSFTGSVGTGHKIAQKTVAGMIRVQLEMGGKNPLLVLNDADLPTAVECAVNGAFFGAGQRCTASSRIIVAEGIHDRFVDALNERMSKLTVGPALNSGVDIGPVINQTQLDKCRGYIEVGRREGAELLRGGGQLQGETPGYFLDPALFVGGVNSMRINQEEIFGPVACVIKVADYEEGLNVANDTPFGLSAGICTQSISVANHFRNNIKSGLAMVNLPTAGLDYHVPFGGRKASSYGPREQGRYAVDFYTITKTSYVSY